VLAWLEDVSGWLASHKQGASEVMFRQPRASPAQSAGRSPLPNGRRMDLKRRKKLTMKWMTILFGVSLGSRMEEDA
jgi:hypothetical protein